MPEGGALELLLGLGVIVFPANEALELCDRVLGVGRELRLRRLANEALLLTIRHHAPAHIFARVWSFVSRSALWVCARE